MKVKIEMVLDVDSQAWGQTYGLTRPSDIRNDVKAYVEALVKDTIEQNGHAGLPRDGAVRRVSLQRKAQS